MRRVRLIRLLYPDVVLGAFSVALAAYAAWLLIEAARGR